jgi:hypothetical protein
VLEWGQWHTGACRKTSSETSTSRRTWTCSAGCCTEDFLDPEVTELRTTAGHLDARSRSAECQGGAGRSLGQVGGSFSRRLDSVLGPEQHPAHHREVTELHQRNSQKRSQGSSPLVERANTGHQAGPSVTEIERPYPSAVGLPPEQPSRGIEPVDPKGGHLRRRGGETSAPTDRRAGVGGQGQCGARWGGRGTTRRAARASGSAVQIRSTRAAEAPPPGHRRRLLRPRQGTLGRAAGGRPRRAAGRATCPVAVVPVPEDKLTRPER